MIQNIETVVKELDCCGCGACINTCPVQAIKYQRDKYGFIIPEINSTKCIFCRKCILTCPSLNSVKKKPKMAYAAKSLKNNVCLNSSSGGIFGTIAKFVLDRGGVIYGCMMDEKFEVRHIRVVSNDQLKEIMRSKYVQSYMGNVYQQVENDLKHNRLVLFSGTPCQVAALNNYVSDNVKDKLFMIDIVCHGVASQEFFDSYLNEIERQYGVIKNYIFRYKKTAKNGMNWYLAYCLKNTNRKKVRNWPEDIYGFLYMQAYIYRESCYKCKFSTLERVGDMTLCDFWGWEKYHSEFALGSAISGVLINDSKAINIWEKISNDLEYIETDIDNIKENNSCLVKPTMRPLNRDALLEFWKKEGIMELNRQFKKKNRKQIYKYFILRNIPQCVVNVLLKIKLRLSEG